MDQWFYDSGLTPHLVGEIEDMSILQVLGQQGMGLFAAPTVVAEEVCRQYNVYTVGCLPSIRQRFYAVSVERRLRHPAVVAISQSAREELFA